MCDQRYIAHMYCVYMRQERRLETLYSLYIYARVIRFFHAHSEPVYGGAGLY